VLTFCRSEEDEYMDFVVNVSVLINLSGPLIVWYWLRQGNSRLRCRIGVDKREISGLFHW